MSTIKYQRMPKVTMRQIGGDDGYSWCVLVGGSIKWNGMTRSEAAWRKKKETEALVSARPTRPVTL